MTEAHHCVSFFVGKKLIKPLYLVEVIHDEMRYN